MCYDTGTLGFASICTRVQNRALVNKRKVRASAGMSQRAEKEQVVEVKVELPWCGVRLNDPSGACPGGRISIDAGPMGVLSALAYGDPSNPLALCLHGYPSDATVLYGHFLLPALVHSGYYAVALDFPNCGQSRGKALRTSIKRTTKNTSFKLSIFYKTSTRTVITLSFLALFSILFLILVYVYDNTMIYGV